MYERFLARVSQMSRSHLMCNLFDKKMTIGIIHFWIAWGQLCHQQYQIQWQEIPLFQKKIIEAVRQVNVLRVFVKQRCSMFKLKLQAQVPLGKLFVQSYLLKHLIYHRQDEMRPFGGIFRYFSSFVPLILCFFTCLRIPVAEING